MALVNLIILCLASGALAQIRKPLVDGPGEVAAIPAWDIAKATQKINVVSQPGYQASSWYHVGSKGTTMGGLVEAGVYDADELFFSDNLKAKVDSTQFNVPWFYRQEFSLLPGTGKHFLLQTNGITSKADVWLNGKQVASKLTQSGAYGGKVYDVTRMVNKSNALVIMAYPTDYNKDFALGFVDWNPYPPDNGTGVWREVTLKQTGPIAMGPLRIITDFTNPGTSTVTITVRSELENLENRGVSGTLQCVITDSTGKRTRLSQPFALGSRSAKTVSTTASLHSPQIWWPKQWGDQPLYTVHATAMVEEEVSDVSDVRSFGIRHVASHVNQHNDTIFHINGLPFQVMGAGYAPDIFLRWDPSRFTTQAQYVLDMGMNTIRLEGKMEHPELYDIADKMGLMVMPGWECCDKWEAWTYNEDITPIIWSENDYYTANVSMRHEAAVLQPHPSILAYLVGSDYWPNDRAAAIYVDALRDWDWQNPVICSAAKRGYPEILGPSGLKMDGPYDWVPPNYWYGDGLGAAFGFGSELGPGVGTPEQGSLKKFLSQGDMDDLWQSPEKGLYHMSTTDSQFHDRSIYNKALFNRYGKPKSLDDYLIKAQMMDYESTRAQYEGYAAKWNADRPATGLIYWMLNNAWPSLHWNQFDYYLHPAGSYFGTKVGSRLQHVAFDYRERTISLIDRSNSAQGPRTVAAELIDLDGKTLWTTTIRTKAVPNTSKTVGTVSGIDKIRGVAFLRLVLQDSDNTVISRNVYWITASLDKLRWSKSTWYYTPVTNYVDYTALNNLQTATLVAYAGDVDAGTGTYRVVLQNRSNFPAFFIRLNMIDSSGEDVVPVFWSDNYVTLFPGEKLELRVKCEGMGDKRIEVSGGNIEKQTIDVGA